jgi:hypothetical protein
VADLSKSKTDRKTLPAGIGKVLKRLHYPLFLLCQLKAIPGSMK